LRADRGSRPSRCSTPARYTTRFAGEVKGFDPLLWIDKKDIKKCGRFTQFALAATSMAIAASGLQIGAETATRIGVAIGSGGPPTSDRM